MISNVVVSDSIRSLRYYRKSSQGPVLQWCLDNIKPNVNSECIMYGKYAWSWERHREYIYFTFGRESDMINFILRWS